MSQFIKHFKEAFMGIFRGFAFIVGMIIVVFVPCYLTFLCVESLVGSGLGLILFVCTCVFVFSMCCLLALMVAMLEKFDTKM